MVRSVFRYNRLGVTHECDGQTDRQIDDGQILRE